MAFHDDPLRQRVTHGAMDVSMKEFAKTCVRIRCTCGAGFSPAVIGQAATESWAAGTREAQIIGSSTKGAYLHSEGRGDRAVAEARR